MYWLLENLSSFPDSTIITSELVMRYAQRQ